MSARMRSVLVLAGALSAASGASLIGTVKDPQGRPVPGAALTLTSRSGATGAATTSGPSGGYRFEGLPYGDYLLRAEAPGFAIFLTGGLHLSSGPAAICEVALELAGVHEQLVVTASSTPQLPEQVSKAMSVIDQSEADTRDAAALADVVALVPGLHVQQLGGPGAFASIQIRGLRDQDTAVLIDGLRLRDASATQGDASGLIEDLLSADANRVEVLRGSGSSLYGANAIGGVVNIITAEGGGQPRGSLLLEGGSLGAFRARLQLSGGLRRDRIEYSLGIAETDVTRGIIDDQPYRNTGAQSRITFHFSPALRLTARLYGADAFGKVLGEPQLLGAPSGMGVVNAVRGVTFLPAPDNPDSTRAGRFLDAALILNGPLSPTLDFSLSGQVVSSSRRYGDGPAGIGFQPDGSTRALYDGRVQNVEAQFHYRFGRVHLFSGGYEFENENYGYDYSDRATPAAASAVSVTERSHTVFAQDQVRLFGDRLQISGAFRAQFFSLGSPGLWPVASAPYQGMVFPAPPAAYTGDGSAAWFIRRSGTKLRAHIGRGYRPPSLFERFGAGFDPIYGYTVYGDPRLRPEHSLGIDAGIDQAFLRGLLKMSASYFYTTLQDVIDFDTSGLINPANDPYGRFIGYRNTRGGLSRGLETSAAIAPAASLSITAAYTYVNAIDRTPLAGDILRTFVVPRHQFSLLVMEQPVKRLLLTIETCDSGSYLAPLYGAVTQTYRFPGVHKLNLGANYRLPLVEQRAVRFFVRADNIFDQAYFESGFPTPGRTAYGGLQFEF